MSGTITPRNGMATMPPTQPVDMMGTQTQAMALETASTAAAAQAEAAVKARYQMALLRPRNIEGVRLRLLAACKRPRFAETAKYAKPIGKEKVVGPSIRFAEAALDELGNTDTATIVLYDDAEKRIIRVTVMDLEKNVSYSQDLIIEKKVERSFLKEGQIALGQRLNSKGKVVYIIEATEDDLLVKQAALTSKAIRGGALRILPGDILEECMDQVDATTRNRDAEDPAAARKRLCDAFYSIGVSPEALVEYLGHAIEACSPAELQDLRQVFAAIREGEATWNAVMIAKNGGEAPKKSEGEGASAPKSAEDLKASMKAKAKAEEAPAAPAAASSEVIDGDLFGGEA